MAQLTKFTDFSATHMFPGDDFFNNTDLYQQAWDTSSEEEHEFDPEGGFWGYTGENNIDFDEMDSPDEDIDDFYGIF